MLALIGGNAAGILSAWEGFARVAIGAALLVAVICLATAVAVAIWAVIRPWPFVILAADEITNYASTRFLTEPDLWRVHLRSLRALEKTARQAQKDGNAAARSITVSLYAFLAGLGFSLVALGTLILELI